MTDAPNLIDLSPERRALLALLLDSEPPTAVLRPRGAQDPQPLSFSQERMWLAERLAQGVLTGVATSRLTLRGPLDAVALERSLATIVQRHEVLRSSYIATEGGLQQVVAENLPTLLPAIDLTGLDGAERESHIARLIEETVRRPFDLSQNPLVRMTLLACDPQLHELLLSVHHSAFDGWSIGIFARELEQLYAAFSQDRQPELPPLAFQYADYAACQRERFSDPEMQRRLEYWKRQLGGRLPTLELPSDRPSPKSRTFAGAVEAIELPAELSRKVEAFCREAGVTPFMALLAAFKVLLHRLTGQEEIIVGSPVANREGAKLAQLIGCFMQPMVLRTRVGGRPSYRELLAEVRRVCLEAYSHQDVPFEQIVRALHPHWDGSHLPLFQVLFNVQSATRAELRLRNIEVSAAEIESGSSALDLSLNLYVGGGAIRGTVEYSTELFDRQTILWFIDGYQRLLEACLDRPDAQLTELQLAPKRPKQRPAFDGISPERRALLQLLLAEQSDAEPAASPTIPRCPRNGDPLPTSFGQERIWFSDQLQGGAINNQAQSWRFTGPLNESALEAALQAILQRHEVLRTSFRLTEGRPGQIIQEEARLPLGRVDLTGLTADEQSVQLRSLADEQCRMPFDLSQPPLLRALLARCGPRDHVLLITGHHLVGDGWSLRVYRRELGLLYEAFSRGEPSPLPPLPLQYADFATWQRRRYREALLDGQLAYWQEQLSGELPVLELPADRTKTVGTARRRKSRFTFRLPEGLYAQLERLRREEGATLFMTLLAGFQALLHRYTGQTDVVIDSPIAGRTRSELEVLIGFFVNSLALRGDLSGRPTFRELLARVRQTCLGAYARQDVPFDRIVASLASQQSRRGQPLATVSFMLHEDITQRMELAGGVQLDPLEPDLSDEFDLTLVLWQGPAGLGELQYDSEQFDEATMARLANHYQRLLTDAAAAPERRIAELHVLPEHERQQLLVDFNATEPAAIPELCWHQLFEAQAARTPDAVAVRQAGREEQWTYRELNERANQLARHLKTLGAAPEQRIGICLERSLATFAAVLGVLKSGAAYVPLDPAYSAQRLEFMLRDSGASLVITSVEQLPLLNPLDLPLVVLDGEENLIAQHSSENLPASAMPDHLAYVMYTSGSTGTPKGALIPHRNVVNALAGWESAYRLREDTTCHLQMASFSFDVFVGDFVRALCSGARLVICPREVLLSPARLFELLCSERVDCAEFVPAVVRTLLEHVRETGQSLDFLRLAIVGSDSWLVGEFEQLQAACGPRTRVINSYGVAEATIDSSYFERAAAPLSAGRLTPVGRPFANVTMHVLDSQLQPTPLGVPGELYVGGPGLARCYLGRPELTAERFVPHPFGKVPGARLYRTGDRARYLSDGNLEFLGRVDFQIKIRGFRIEPGEIESALTRHAAIRQAVVVATGERLQDKQLAAYVVLHEAIPAEAHGQIAAELRQHLSTRLPEYMVPAWFVVLPELPLSKNGKVDRRALPVPQGERPAASAFVPLESETQRRIAAIWAELLGTSRVGLTDNFFDLGGHSLLLFQLQSKLREAFGRELPLVELFRLSTVQAQAEQFCGTVREAPAFEQARQRVEKQKLALARKQQLARPKRPPLQDTPR